MTPRQREAYWRRTDALISVVLIAFFLAVALLPNFVA